MSTFHPLKITIRAVAKKDLSDQETRGLAASLKESIERGSVEHRHADARHDIWVQDEIEIETDEALVVFKVHK